MSFAIVTGPLITVDMPTGQPVRWWYATVWWLGWCGWASEPGRLARPTLRPYLKIHNGQVEDS